MLKQNEPSLVAFNRPVRPFLRVGGSWPKQTAKYNRLFGKVRDTSLMWYTGQDKQHLLAQIICKELPSKHHWCLRLTSKYWCNLFRSVKANTVMREQQIFPLKSRGITVQPVRCIIIKIFSTLMKWKTKAPDGRQPISLLTCLLIVIPCQPTSIVPSSDFSENNRSK